MAELDDRQKTESPTPRRLEEARKQGQVPRSRDLSAATVVLAGGAALLLLGELVGGHLVALVRDAMIFTRPEALYEDSMLRSLTAAGAGGAAVLLPLCAVLFAAAALAPLSIGGWNVSAAALKLSWERLDPVAGMQRVFSLQGLLELLKALARFAVVALAAYLLLRSQFAEFSALGSAPVPTAVARALHLCGVALLVLGGALGLIAAVDAPLSLWQYQRNLRMSREEIRDEQRTHEGSPENRGRLRQAQQELARKRMMHEVPRADAIITNPTHYAVALRYDEHKMRAPRVVALGADRVAHKIRELGRQHGVPLIEAPPLARALYAACDLGDEIPTRLYAAVAQLLTYVYQLRAARRAGHSLPSQPRFDTPEM